jgi:hypothetical protein
MFRRCFYFSTGKPGMRRRFWRGVLLCALLPCAGPVLGQTKENPVSEEKAQKELLDLENHWLQVEGDPDALESILAPDFLHVVGAGIITKDDQLNFMRKHPAPASKQAKHFEDMHVRVYGTAGIVNGVVVASEAGTTRRTLFTDVFAYRGGKWQAVSAQELPKAEKAH